MDAKSEVILRHPERIHGQVLLVNPPQDQLCQMLDANVSIWTWNFADYQYLKQICANSFFDTQIPQHTFEQIIIFVPKAKELLAYVLEQCVAALGSGKNIYLVGEKKAGIEGSAKLLTAFGKTIKIDSARHCQLWQLNIEKTIHAKPLEQWVKRYTYTLQEQSFNVCALPGVFSQNKLDIGTAQLLPLLNQVKSGELLDFGCGAGIIALVLAKLNPQNRITAADIDAFALQSTTLTFAQNQVSTQLETIAISDIQDIQQSFDAVVSNPPFHQGIKTNYQASENLCQYAQQRLKPQGELWIVANRFLNYSPLIEQSFGHCQTILDSHGFKVLYAKNML